MASRQQPGANAGPDAPHPLAGLPGRYRVRRHLASGGMAAVWCADDLVLGRAVAIKVLAERFAHDDVAMRRFKREARAAARVSNHAHVVTIFDVGDLEPPAGAADADAAARPFIVMEYLAGGTVADAIRLQAVRRQEAVRWLREAASALDDAHGRGIVHRDIKPANFLLDRSRVLHVADFGIARLVSEDTISTADELLGTAAYLAPEQALGRAATGASDRYALAVAAFELLTGRRPFAAAHFAAQARQHIEEDPPAASALDRTIPPAVDTVLARGMAKAPEARYPSAGELVAALETALWGGIPVSTPPVERRPRPAVARRAPIVPSFPPLALDPLPPTLAGRALSPPPAAAPQPLVVAAGGGAPWSPADLIQRGAGGGGGRGRILALAALALVFGVVAAMAVTGMRGSPTPSAATVHHGRRTIPRTAAATATRHRRSAPTTSSPVTTGAATTEAAAEIPAGDTAALQLTGHQEMLAGEYQRAITTLRKVVSAAPPASLTYAYGLYDLGRSLYLSGNAGAAVQVLEKRMKIPNQTAIVQQTLDEALRATGQTTAGDTSTAPAGQTTTAAPRRPPLRAAAATTRIDRPGRAPAAPG